ncbi:MAG: GNAT family N-acetyltransferase [Chloroflexi bacterium]|nr:GNAT family N-acetyltransferase [Ktedonobacteraceae bacterium]MBV9021438.1 GNAT family N-acetyltransferase [Ktedonobacteraceae bacterium]MBV9709142.1 GNAT family N-acetyltransferase [Chloroflexota bacterium]
MIVRLHNLAARSSAMADLEAVTALLRVCDLSESGTSDYTEEDVQYAWQTQDFNLKTDAWVIVTRKGGQLVGYADVRQSEAGQFCVCIRVHPDYHGRGIGTLLIWLTEERARQLMKGISTGRRVTLSSTVSNFNQKAHKLLEREGYTLVHSFWRLMIDIESMPAYACREAHQQGKISIDLPVDGYDATAGTTHLRERQKAYIAHLYNVYEKELRAKVEFYSPQASLPQPIAV